MVNLGRVGSKTFQGIIPKGVSGGASQRAEQRQLNLLKRSIGEPAVRSSAADLMTNIARRIVNFQYVTLQEVFEAVEPTLAIDELKAHAQAAMVRLETDLVEPLRFALKDADYIPVAVDILEAIAADEIKFAHIDVETTARAAVMDIIRLKHPQLLQAARKALPKVNVVTAPAAPAPPIATPAAPAVPAAPAAPVAPAVDVAALQQELGTLRSAHQGLEASLLAARGRIETELSPKISEQTAEIARLTADAVARGRELAELQRNLAAKEEVTKGLTAKLREAEEAARQAQESLAAAPKASDMEVLRKQVKKANEEAKDASKKLGEKQAELASTTEELGRQIKTLQTQLAAAPTSGAMEELRLAAQRSGAAAAQAGVRINELEEDLRAARAETKKDPIETELTELSATLTRLNSEIAGFNDELKAATKSRDKEVLPGRSSTTGALERAKRKFDEHTTTLKRVEDDYLNAIGGIAQEITELEGHLAQLNGATAQTEPVYNEAERAEIDKNNRLIASLGKIKGKEAAIQSLNGKLASIRAAAVERTIAQATAEMSQRLERLKAGREATESAYVEALQANDIAISAIPILEGETIPNLTRELEQWDQKLEAVSIIISDLVGKLETQGKVKAGVISRATEINTILLSRLELAQRIMTGNLAEAAATPQEEGQPG